MDILLTFLFPILILLISGGSIEKKNSKGLNAFLWIIVVLSIGYILFAGIGILALRMLN